MVCVCVLRPRYLSHCVKRVQAIYKSPPLIVMQPVLSIKRLRESCLFKVMYSTANDAITVKNRLPLCPCFCVCPCLSYSPRYEKGRHLGVIQSDPKKSLPQKKKKKTSCMKYHPDGSNAYKF